MARYEFGTDSLTLHSDGTYVQEIRVKGKPDSLRVTGKWIYMKSISRINLGDMYVIPDPYSDEWDEKTMSNRGAGSLPVERYFWSRKLRLGPDEGHPYVKE